MVQPISISAAIGSRQLFTIAFGTIVGIAWVFLAGPWLRAAGSFGTMGGLCVGAVLMIPIVWCYARLAESYSGAGGELLYVGRTLGVWPGLLAGWFLAFVYIALVAFHCVTVAWLVDVGLAHVGAAFHPVLSFNPNIGLLASGILFVGIGVANLRGISVASRTQDVVVAILVVATLAFAGNTLWLGRTDYLHPYIVAPAGSRWAGVLKVLATAPFLYGGFGTAVQAVSDIRGGRPRRMLAVLGGAVVAAAVFYSFVILSVAAALPRQQLLSYPLPALDAFAAAFHSPLATAMAAAVALIALCTSWNGVFIGAWKLSAALAVTPLFPWSSPSQTLRRMRASRSIVFVWAASLAVAAEGRSGLLGIVNSVALMMAIIYLLMACGTLRQLGTGCGIWTRWGGMAAAALMVSLAVGWLAAENLWQSSTSARDVLVLAVWTVVFACLALTRRRHVHARRIEWNCEPDISRTRLRADESTNEGRGRA